MKVKELMFALNKVDQEADINFQVGFNGIYRKFCAHFINNEEDGDNCLAFLDAHIVTSETIMSSKDSEVVVTLKQSFFTDEYFEDCLKEFIEKGGK